MSPTHSLSVRPRRPLSPAFGARGLLVLAIVVACDSGTPATDAAPGKASPAAKAEPGKAPLAKAEPGKAPEPTADAKADATPTPTPEPALEAPEPAAAPAEPALEAPEPAAAPAEPAAAPADVADVPEPAEPAAEPAVTGSGSTPIALGPDAEILKLVLAHDVVDRQPVDPATTFPAGQKVSLFIEARNESEEEQRLRVTWETVSSGRRTPPVGVTIPTRKLHRTRAYRTMKKAGEYRCIVLGDDDRELAVLPFTIE